MANPGPNIVSPTYVRANALISLAVTPASVSATTSAEQTFTLSGVAVGDWVGISTTASTGNATAIAGARVSAANTIAIRYVNPTAGALTPAADTYLVNVIRAEPDLSNFGVTGGQINYGSIAGATT
jgi:phage-related minor tail protein